MAARVAWAGSGLIAAKTGGQVGREQRRETRKSLAFPFQLCVLKAMKTYHPGTIGPVRWTTAWRRGTQRRRTNSHVKTEVKVGVMLPQPRNTRKHRKLEEARNDPSPPPSSPTAFREGVALSTAWFWTLSFQH